MSKSSIFAKVAFAAIAGAMALGGSAASAQPYGGPAPAYGGGYDPCQREASGRGIVGALVGGGLGATVGSQMAASGHRTDGSLLGGVLGALAGAKVGNSSAACNSAPPPPLPPPPPRADYGAPYAQGYDMPPPPPYRYGSRVEEVYVYGHRGERLRIVDRPPGADGCTLAESPIYMPDGRVQKRFVRVCQDSSGRYQVVD
ncbi:hypothetical protein DJ021_17020 [Phenylobacterium hankyongense]|uniref:17 kDa surface antigen n=1 Tax=Phenylobacterium hankyongense TaxID=1813876 RepID=A0A328B1Q2_9CAUL|nr:glycine zipper 2TM domain-containing protein [Phenylobacterium hankyongense]RAK61382.1 hypothetical protein DJ021_17020 [Phenylobacterium hankyongense]